MGMYDNVIVYCPYCGGQIEFQSKAGGCTLINYNLDSVPIDIANDLIGKTEVCGKCEQDVHITIDPKVLPKMVHMVVYKDGE